MRSPRLVSSALAAVLGLAACGDDGGSNPIDARRIDAAVIDAATIDAAVDASIDATVDASTPSATTVWVYGDIVTNNVSQLGKFTHPAAGVVVPTLVPAAGELAFTNFPVPFSVSNDNTRVAYVGRAAATDPWKLSISATDGTGIVDVFTAATTMVAVSDVVLSPDKTKIAFRADLATAGVLDIYVVAAVANSTPVKVSPDRVDVNLDAQAFMVWSPDSRYVAFGGEFTTDNLNEIRIRDTMMNTTAAPLSAAAILAPDNPRGLLSAPVWAPGNMLFASARITAAGERRIYISLANGSSVQVLANTVITRGDNTMSQASHFALSPNGATIVFASDAPTATAFELYAMPSNGGAAATRLTAGTIAAGRGLDPFRPIRYAPSGMAVAVAADWGATDEKYQPYVVPTMAGGTIRRLATMGVDTDAERDAQALAWTGDSMTLYVIGDATTANNDFELYALDVSMTDQPTVAKVDPPASGDAFELTTRF